MTALIPARWREHVSPSTDSPSRRHNVSAELELSELQAVANFIQEMARKLSLPLICINTAIVYTQRFYLYHSLVTFEKHCLGASALFLAAKVEDHPRKVEHIYQVAKHLGHVNKEVKDADYIDDVLLNENIILQTLGFEIYIEHPHTHVVRLCEMFRMSKTFSQTAYILATYCLQLTRMCLFHKPGIVACLCIRMTCKMTKENPQPKDGKNWFQFGDATLTDVVLESLCEEFQTVLKTCPPKWKNRTLQNNHQNLANKMVFSIAGLPMVGDTVSTSDSDLSNSAVTSAGKRSTESIINSAPCTPESSSATPQTCHRFSDMPSMSPLPDSPASPTPTEQRAPTPSQIVKNKMSEKIPKNPRLLVIPKEERKMPASKEERKMLASKEERKMPAPKEERKMPVPKEERKMPVPKEERKMPAPRQEKIPMVLKEEKKMPLDKHVLPFKTATPIEQTKKHQGQSSFSSSSTSSSSSSLSRNHQSSHHHHNNHHQSKEPTTPTPTPKIPKLIINRHQDTAQYKSSIQTTVKPHEPNSQSHLQSNKKLVENLNKSNEKKHHSHSFQKSAPAAPHHHKPIEAAAPRASGSSNKSSSFKSETKSHHHHNHHHNHSSSSSSSSSNSRRHSSKSSESVDRAAVALYHHKTEESQQQQQQQRHHYQQHQPQKQHQQRPDLMINKDMNQWKASHSSSQAMLPQQPMPLMSAVTALDNWSSASLDFSCLSDNYSDLNPWGSLMTESPSPQYHQIQRESSGVSTASSGMNLLKLSNQEIDRSTSAVSFEFVDNLAKRFKPNN